MDRARKTDDLRQSRLALIAALDEFENVACVHATRRAFFPAETIGALLETLALRFEEHVQVAEGRLAPFLLDPLAQDPADFAAMFCAFRETLDRPAHEERDEQLRVQAADLVALMRAQLRKEETLLFAMTQPAPKRRAPRGDRS